VHLPVSTRSTRGAVTPFLNPPAQTRLLPWAQSCCLSTRLQEGGALGLDNNYALFNKRLTRNAGRVIKIPICFRKGF